MFNWGLPIYGGELVDESKVYICPRCAACVIETYDSGRDHRDAHEAWHDRIGA